MDFICQARVFLVREIACYLSVFSEVTEAQVIIDSSKTFITYYNRPKA